VAIGQLASSSPQMSTRLAVFSAFHRLEPIRARQIESVASWLLRLQRASSTARTNRTSRHHITLCARASCEGCTSSDRRHNSLQEPTSRRTLARRPSRLLQRESVSAAREAREGGSTAQQKNVSRSERPGVTNQRQKPSTRDESGKKRALRVLVAE
jgi:hypothetical protein